MSAEIINLRQFRKANRRADKERQAAINREKHGRTKGEKLAQSKERKRDERNLDGTHLGEIEPGRDDDAQ